MFRWVNAWIPRIWSSPIAIVGSILATVSGCLLVLVIAGEVFNPTRNAYTAAVLLIAVPMLFVLGLLLIPVGIWITRRRRRKKGLDPRYQASATPATLIVPVRKLVVIAALTFVNLGLLGLAGHAAISYMDTAEFCGTACHSIMEPEYEAYKRSPHSHVHCVACHIGEGAGAAVQAKLDGLRQLWHTLRGNPQRPVDTPVHSLSSSHETCEKCHAPAKFYGTRLSRWMHYEADEANTASVNVILLNIGGKNPSTGKFEGIHSHINPKLEIRYEALDEERHQIGKLTVTREGEGVTEYLPEETDAEVVETRVMDCMDCHNRPTHIFDGSPEQAIDWALSESVLDRAVPYLKQLALPLLTGSDRGRDREALEKAFGSELEAAYRAEHPEAVPAAAALAHAAQGLATLYRRNIFPEMNVRWGTYPSHVGHRDEEPERIGCFRCHDEKHKTSEGKVLSQDCELCHLTLADEEAPGDLDDSLQQILGGGK